MNSVDVINRLEAFLQDNDWSKAAASRLEDYLDDAISHDSTFPSEDLRNDLASFSPGGGEYLFDENQIRKAIQACLVDLKQMNSRANQ